VIQLGCVVSMNQDHLFVALKIIIMNIYHIPMNGMRSLKLTFLFVKNLKMKIINTQGNQL